MDAAFFTENLWIPIVLALIGAFFAGRQLRTKTQATSRDTRVRERGAAERQEAAARAQKDLAEWSHEQQVLLAEFQSSLGTRSAIEVEAERIALRSDEDRRAFVAEQVKLWADPILPACGDLRHRLHNILYLKGYQWLKSGRGPTMQTSMTSDHFRDSTAYVFCQYFCYVELLTGRLGYVFEEQGDARDAFLETLRKASRKLGSHDWSGDTGEEKDSQIFHWQQRALGEIVTIEDAAGRARAMGFAAFLTKKQREDFGPHLSPLYAMIDGLEEAGPRWRRLEEYLDALNAVELECRALVGLPRRLKPLPKPQGPPKPPKPTSKAPKKATVRPALPSRKRRAPPATKP